MEGNLPSERLFDLYKVALEEYRFEVQLGWDRAKYFLVLNSAILSVATGLFKMGNSRLVFLFVALIFLLGFSTCVLGRQAILKNHEYYRRTIVQKTLIEHTLGLANAIPGLDPSSSLAVGTTRGQRDRLSILHDAEKWIYRGQRWNSVTSVLRFLLFGIAAVDFIGLCTALCYSIKPPSGAASPIRFLLISLVRGCLS